VEQNTDYVVGSLLCGEQIINMPVFESS